MSALPEVASLAGHLMNEHGLGHVPFQFDNAKRRIGCCHFRGGKPVLISLSAALTAVNTIERMEQTILHEIAHGLVGIAHQHDAVWERKAREIGVRKPSARSSHVDTVVPTAPYNAFCENCSTERPIAVRYRKPQAVRYTCPTHRTVIVWLPAGKTLVRPLDGVS